MLVAHSIVSRVSAMVLLVMVILLIVVLLMRWVLVFVCSIHLHVALVTCAIHHVVLSCALVEHTKSMG